MRRKILFIALPIVLVISCSEPKNNYKPENKHSIDTTVVATKEKNSKMTSYFPFKIYEDAERFTIMVPLESPELYPKYSDLFEKYGYEGNGYCWEGHITQILEKTKPELLQHIDFDPEAGGFYAHVDTKENQLKIVELLSPIFLDLQKLEVYVKKADRSRVDD